MRSRATRLTETKARFIKMLCLWNIMYTITHTPRYFSQFLFRWLCINYSRWCAFHRRLMLLLLLLPRLTLPLWRIELPQPDRWLKRTLRIIVSQYPSAVAQFLELHQPFNACDSRFLRSLVFLPRLGARKSGNRHSHTRICVLYTQFLHDWWHATNLRFKLVCT